MNRETTDMNSKKKGLNLHEGIFFLHLLFWSSFLTLEQNSLRKDEALVCIGTFAPGVIMPKLLPNQRSLTLRLHLKVSIKPPNMPKLKTREIFRKPTFQISNSMHSKDNSMVKQVSSSYMIASSSHLNFLSPLNIQNTFILVFSQFYNSSEIGT